MKPVLYRYKDSESVIKPMDGYTPGDGWVPLFDEVAIKSATAAALDRAALEVEKVNRLFYFRTQQDIAKGCADAIRALKNAS